MTPQLKVDERCAERCAALAKGLADCESTGGYQCTTERQRWRGFCVTNAACNPTGADPLRAVQRECAILSKRLAVCGRSIDGQHAPNMTALCQDVRKKIQQLCREGAVAPEAVVTGAAGAARSAAITQAYREGKHAQPAAREREAGTLASAAAGLLLANTLTVTVTVTLTMILTPTLAPTLTLTLTRPAAGEQRRGVDCGARGARTYLQADTGRGGHRRRRHLSARGVPAGQCPPQPHAHQGVRARRRTCDDHMRGGPGGGA
jgi:hypothetical protein